MPAIQSIGMPAAFNVPYNKIGYKDWPLLGSLSASFPAGSVNRLTHRISPMRAGSTATLRDRVGPMDSISAPCLPYTSTANMMAAPPTYRSSTLPSSLGLASGLIPSLAPLQDQTSYHLSTRERSLPQLQAPIIKPKEEKIGGVAAHLDYEMEEMVDFVSETAQGMYEFFESNICLADIDMTRSVLDSKKLPHAEFRKYVSQVLTSTRLPSSTILLGLHYLSRRMTMLSDGARYGQGPRGLYHLLTIALMLGSKFLDDNTFQNRSWSEVSNISVQELNYLEIQWLTDIGWNMHIDQNDPEGFQLWLGHWERFQARKTDPSLSASTRLSCTGQRNSIGQSQRQLPPLPSIQTQHSDCYLSNILNPSYSSSNLSYSSQSSAWRSTSTFDNYSPPSAPDTGPATPESYGFFEAYGYLPETDCFGKSNLRMPLPLPIHTLSSYSNPYPTHCPSTSCPIYCECGFWKSTQHSYQLNSASGLQPVMG